MVRINIIYITLFFTTICMNIAHLKKMQSLYGPQEQSVLNGFFYSQSASTLTPMLALGQCVVLGLLMDKCGAPNVIHPQWLVSYVDRIISYKSTSVGSIRPIYYSHMCVLGPPDKGYHL